MRNRRQGATGKTAASGSGERPTNHVLKPHKEGFLRANPIATFHDWRKRKKQMRNSGFRRPSVALASYEISDSRSSTMSSLLLLFAILEGMCGLVLPICNAFSRSESSVKRYYYEDFLLFQYGLSILALLYLQGLIFYYDRKENSRRKARSMFKNLSRQSTVLEDSEEGISWHAEEPQSAHSDCSTLKHCLDVRSLTHIANADLSIETNDGLVEVISPAGLQHQATASSIAVNGTSPRTTQPSRNQEKPDLIVHSATSLRPSLAYPKMQYGRMVPCSSKVSFSEESIEAKSPENDEPVEKSNTSIIDSAPEIRITPASESSTPDTAKTGPEEEAKPPNPGMVHLRKALSKSGSLLESLGMDQQSIRRKSMIPIQLIFGDRDGKNTQSWYLSRDSEGVNLYLRLGAVGFGFGVMIFDGFKIAGHWETSSSERIKCHGTLWIPIHIVHFIYVFWQTYFLFKHHQVVFNVQKFILRFLLCHLAMSNLCQWLKTIVDEISNEPGHEDAHHPTSAGGLPVAVARHLPDLGNNASMHSALGNGTHMDYAAPPGCTTTAKYLAPFLFPCAIEYSLIAGAMFYKIFQKVGNVREESERLERLRKANTMTTGFAECHRSHKGLFIGLLFFMATLVTMCLFFIFFGRNERRSTAITLYQCTELVLLALGTLTCLASMVRLRILKFCDLSEESAFDDNLLLVGLLGMIFYDLFLLIPALEEFHTDPVAARLFAAKALLEIIQTMLQVLFILEASRRCAATMSHVKEKPGRTLITLLLILNLAMWFVNTFEVKRADNHSIHINYFTGMAWKIITHLALPLIVFFRFHSTVCLSDIWANAYRFQSE